MKKTIKELRVELQEIKKHRREAYWAHGFLVHDPSIYLTRLLIATPIKANQVTMIMLALGITGSLLLLSPIMFIKILGFFLIYMNFLFDSSDGEVARYRKEYSIRGVYLDDMNHLITPPLFIICLGVGLLPFTELSTTLIFFTAVLGGLSWSVMKSQGKESFYLLIRHYAKNPENYSNILSSTSSGSHILGESIVSKESFIRKILSVRFQLRQFLFAYLLFTIAFIVDILLLENYATMSWLLMFYGVFLTLHLIEEFVKGYLQIEREVGHLANSYKITKKES